MSRRYQGVVLADGPVGYWPLDELTGTTATDRGSTGVNGAYTGTFVYGAVPFPGGGRAPYFDGSTSYVLIADNNAWSISNGAATWEFWLWPQRSNAGVVEGFFTKGSSVSGDREWVLYRNSGNLGNLAMLKWNGGTSGVSEEADCPSSQVSNQGRWFHVVLTNGGGATWVYYVNGRRYAATITGSVTAVNLATSLRIGNTHSNDGSVLYQGFAAHFALYNKVLDGPRVMAHYRAGLGLQPGARAA